MATENKTKIHSVHYTFIKSVVKDYITEDSLLPDQEEEIPVVKKSA